MWVLIALLILFLTIILILCVPVDFIFSARINERPSYTMQLFWFFGMVKSDLKKTKAKTSKNSKTIKKSHDRHNIKTSTLIHVLKIKGLFPKLYELIVTVMKSLKIRRLAINLKLGFENPADTAFLFALAGPINYLCNMPAYNINLSPLFDGDFFLDATIYNVTRIWPILIIAALFRFIFSLPVIRIAKILVATR